MTKEISVGSYVATHCTKCKLDLGHTIILMSGDKIVRVKCRTCGSEHVYRDKTKKRITTKRAAPAVKKEKLLKNQQKRWEAAIMEAKGGEISYDMGRSYKEGDIVLHNIFGKGIVINRSSKKVTLLFQDKERILVSTNK